MISKNSIVFGLLVTFFSLIVAMIAQHAFHLSTKNAILPAFILGVITVVFYTILHRSVYSSDRNLFIKIYFGALFVKMVSLIAIVMWYAIQNTPNVNYFYILILYSGLTILLSLNLFKISHKTTE